ncbi:hypothetical protein NSA27_02440 [Clostridium tepidum]|nr:hypothetical protein [Clostridium tepidum]MCR1933561.1 hypothetical protein [Clostridium tepidum]
MQPKVAIIEPDITPDENEENLRQALEILQRIADDLAQKINGA